jgi:hypothetical protein
VPSEGVFCRGGTPCRLVAENASALFACAALHFLASCCVIPRFYP